MTEKGVIVGEDGVARCWWCAGDALYERYHDDEWGRSDAGIVRNRAKIEATINNARRCLDLVDEFGSLAAYVWGWEPDPAAEPRDTVATAMSKDLRRRGWSFVGPVTAYSFMEAMGLVNDHLSACAIRAEVEADRESFTRPRTAATRRSARPGRRRPRRG